MSFRGGQERKAGKPVKKISVNPVSKDTLESSVSEYVCVVEENIVTVRNVRQSHICPGVFYAQGRIRKFTADAVCAPHGEQGKINLPYSIISENFFKNFWKDPSKRAFPFGRKNEGKFMPSLSASWNGKGVKSNGTITFPGRIDGHASV